MIILKDGDILEGVLTNWKWLQKKEEGDKRATFELHGSVTLGSNGEKKEGVFLCEDNGVKLKVSKQLE